MTLTVSNNTRELPSWPDGDSDLKLPPGVSKSVFNADGLTFIDTRVLVAGELPKHTYDYYQIVINTWAPAKVDWWSEKAGSKLLELAKGDIICQPAGDAHSCSWEIPWSHSSFLVSQKDIGGLAENLGVSPYLVNKLRHVACDPLIFQMTHSLIAERENEPLNGALYAQSFLQMLMHRVLLRLDQPAGKLQIAPREESLSPLLLEKIVDYIAEHIGDSISLADLARVANTSPFHFSRLFKNATGTSPHAFVLSRRTTIACRFLQESDEAISIIATKSGFSSQSHMDRAFKKILKMSPASYRQQFHS